MVGKLQLKLTETYLHFVIFQETNIHFAYLICGPFFLNILHYTGTLIFLNVVGLWGHIVLKCELLLSISYWYSLGVLALMIYDVIDFETLAGI